MDARKVDNEQILAARKEQLLRVSRNHCLVKFFSVFINIKLYFMLVVFVKFKTNMNIANKSGDNFK